MKNNVKAIILSILLALVLFGGLLAAQSHVLGKYEQTEVIVARRDIDEGMDITKENAEEYFETKKVVKSLAVDSSIKNMKGLYGSYTGVKLKKGTIVYQEELQRESEEISNLVEPVEVSVALTSFSDGVSGTLRKGDYVFIYFVDKENGEVEIFGTDPVYIKQSFSSSGEPVDVSDEQTAASVFSLVIERSMDGVFCEAVKTKEIILIRADGSGQ